MKLSKFLAIIAAVLLPLNLTPPPAHADTCSLDVPIGASGDDGYVSFTYYEVMSGGVADVSASNSASYDNNRFFLRFPLNVPPGATIQAAYLTVYADVSTGNGALIYVDQSDDSPAIASYNDYTGRSLSSSPVTWNPTEWVSWQYYNSPSLVSLVQETVNRAGWQSGSHIQFFGYPNGSGVHFSFFGYDASPSYPANLHVEYECGSPGPTPTVTPTPTNTPIPVPTPAPTSTVGFGLMAMESGGQDTEIESLGGGPTPELPYHFEPLPIPEAPHQIPINFTTPDFINQVGSYALTLLVLLDQYQVLGIFVVIMLGLSALWWLYSFVTDRPILPTLNVSGGLDTATDLYYDEEYRQAETYIPDFDDEGREVAFDDIEERRSRARKRNRQAKKLIRYF